MSPKRAIQNTGQPPPTKKGRKRDTKKRLYENINSSSSSDDVESKPKVKRPDRSQRLQNRKGTKTTTVKASFLGRWTPYSTGNVKMIFDEILFGYVSSISQMVVRGSMIANEAILNYLRQGEVPPISSTFFRQCMVAESSDPVINYTIQNEFVDHPEIKRFIGDGFSINYAANLYTTVFDNNLWMPFESRLKGYVQDWIVVNNVDPDLTGVIICRIIGKTHSLPTVLSQNVWAFIVEERLLLGNPDVLYPETIQADILLRYLFRILEYKRVYQRYHGFSIAPLSEVRRHHVVIDTTVLYVMINEVFKRLGEDSPMWIQEVALLPKEEAIHQYRDVMWSKMVDYLNLSRHTFTHSISTNGIEYCVKFMQPKTECEELNLFKILQRVDPTAIIRVISIDPGRTNLITAYDPLYDRFYTLSRRGYYSVIKSSLQRIKNWERKLQDINQMMSDFSLRSSDLETCRGYRRVYFKVYNRLWTARLEKKRAKESFRMYSVKRSVIDRFFMSFMAGGLPKPIIAYGAATMRAGGRGELNVPVKAVYAACRRFYLTFKVNEHLSTQCHSECGSRMHPVKKHGLQKPVRGLKYCRVCEKFVNRDRDSCKSINHVASSISRPYYLRFNRPYEWKQALDLLPQ
jgi:hypothetical protein